MLCFAVREAAYYVFKDSGYAPTIASVVGGKPPIDDKSLEVRFSLIGIA